MRRNYENFISTTRYRIYGKRTSRKCITFWLGYNWSKTKVLERQVAKFCEVNRSVCLGSQTACAEMTLLLLGVGYGDEVKAV